MLNTGGILPGGWKVEEKLGEGSYCTVWRVRRELAGNTELAAVKFPIFLLAQDLTLSRQQNTPEKEIFSCIA